MKNRITVLVLAGLLILSMMAVTAVTSAKTPNPKSKAATTINNKQNDANEVKVKGRDTDSIEHESVDKNDANEAVEGTEKESSEKSGDVKEADENLPGGGHADRKGSNVDHQFEGVE